MNPTIWTAIKPIASQAARDFLRTVGTALAAHGYITGGAGTEAFVGAGMTLAGLFWGWFTTSGYLQLAGLLKKLTATKTQAAAVEVAKVMPSAEVTGAADKAKVIATAAGVIKVLVVALLLSMLIAPSAFAQAKRSPINLDPLGLVSKPAQPQASATPSLASLDNFLNDLGTKIQTVEKDIADKVIADLNAAITDATNHNDNISLPCWKANLALAQALPAEWTTPPALPIGIALSIQIQRDLISAITSNDQGSLKVACAALWGDQLQQISQVGLLFGVKIATGGLL